MKIGVTHEISDAESFEERGLAMVEELPDGIKNLQGCFSTDGTIGHDRYVRVGGRVTG
jgi:hypothetical protein